MFNTNVPSYRGTQVSSVYRCFEREKQRNYEQGSTMEMRWVLLPHLYFNHDLVVLIVLLLYFTEYFFSLSLQKESCDVMAVLQD